MPRKTREQVWRELDELGEEAVRARIGEAGKGRPSLKLVREWLERREKVNEELRTTSDRVQRDQIAAPRVRRQDDSEETARADRQIR